MKTDLFQSCGHCWVFQICWQIDCSTFTASSFRIWNSSTGIPSPPLAFCVHLCMKCSLGMSNFLEEISSLSHSVIFLYFFALITEKPFLSPRYSLEFCIQMLISLLFASLLFTAICKATSGSRLAFLHFFSMGMVLIFVSCTMSRTFIHHSSGTLSIRSRPLNLFLTSTV